MSRFSLASVVAALSLAASASSTMASVTIGQVGDPVASGCNIGYDWLQQTVTSGNSYVVPATGGVTHWTVTSWTTFGGASGGDMLTMKIFRNVNDPATFQVVGHDGPRTTTAGGTAGNTFPANVPVVSGDILGFYTASDTSRCAFSVPGDQYRAFQGNAPDGQSEGPFDFEGDYRLDIEAVLVPSNVFTPGTVTRNKKKGTATLAFNLSNPGDLAGSGQGAQVASTGAVPSKAVPAGIATLTVKAKGRKKRKLDEKGKVKLNLAVTYTPTGGNPSTQSVKVKLKKRL